MQAMMNKTFALCLPCVVAVAALAFWPVDAPAAHLYEALLNNCQNQSLKPDDRIAGCTELLRSGIFTHKFKAAFLVDRAIAYRDKGDTADAIVDLNQAVEYNPDYQAARQMRDELDPQHATPAAQ
jgi:lipoprotein NlpI